MENKIANMDRVRIVIIQLIVALLIMGCGKKQLTIPELIRKADPALVFITAYDQNNKPFSTGSGFIVDPEGIIVTNYHVIRYSDNIEIKLSDSRTFPVTNVIDYDETIDYAILKIGGSKLPVVPLGDDTKTERGESVLIIGNPMGLEHSHSTGTLDLRRTRDSIEFLQISADVNPGNSGGPLFNLFGEVIGVVTLKSEADGIGFAIPISHVKSSLQKGVAYRYTLSQVLAAQIEKDQKIFEESFSGFSHKEDLFSIQMVKNWQTWTYEYWSDTSNTQLNKLVTLAPQQGYDSKNYHLSEGVRVRFWYPMQGNTWTVDSPSEWGPIWLQEYLRVNKGFAVTDDSTETYLTNGQAVKIYEILGKNEKSKGPEKVLVLVTCTKIYRLTVEFVTPISKSDSYEILFNYIRQSFKIGPNAEHPVYR